MEEPYNYKILFKQKMKIYGCFPELFSRLLDFFYIYKLS